MRRFSTLGLLVALLAWCGSAHAAIGQVQANSAAANNITFTSTATSGNLLVICGHRDGSTTAPSLPAGYTNIANAGANTNAMRIAYKISDGTETAVTMTNATSVGYEEFSGTASVSPIGGNAAGGASSTSMAYNTLTMSVTNGTSWVVGCGGHRTATNVNQAPTGMTLRTGTSTTDFMMADTNAGVSSWSTQSVTVNANSGWRTYTVEILAPCTGLCHVTATGSGSGTSGTNSFTLAYTATGTNNALLFSMFCNATSGAGASGSTFTSSGVTTTQLTAFLNNGTAKSVATYGVIAPDTSSHTYTITFTGKSNCGNATFWTVDEFSGNDTTGGTTTFDANNGTTGASGVCSLTVTPANDSDMAWGSCWESGGGVGSGFTLGFAPVSNSRSEYKLLGTGTSGNAQTVDWTSSGTTWLAAAATVKATGGGGGGGGSHNNLTLMGVGD